MKKTYKIEVGCVNCVNKKEEAAQKIDGEKDVNVNFMLLIMKVEFEDGYKTQKVMPEILQSCRKIESDCEIYF